MNTQILELIAARAGSNGRTGVMELIARLRSNSGGIPAVDPRELLARMGNGNPAISSFLKEIATQQAANLQGEASVIDVQPVQEHLEVTESGTSAVHEDSSAKQIELLTQRADSMLAELKLLRERNDLLAAAVGACCLCWGQDLGCRSCRGRGGPGFCMPDEALFGEYLVPAIQTLRAQKAKVRNFAAGVQSNGTEAETPLTNAANY